MNELSPTGAPCWPPVAVVVLNWNGWRDTLACLTSVFALDYARFQVIVCDNGSADGSLAEIERWAAAARRPSGQGGDARALRWLRVDRAVVEQGTLDVQAFAAADLVLLANGANLGFAVGNNVGIRAALAYSKAAYVWLLNNDTVVDGRALSELVDTAQALPGCGLCGSTLVGYDDPQRVIARAGAYSRWLARTRHLGVGADAASHFSSELRLGDHEYPVGASLLLSRELLRDIGLLAEDYFLYFEELDLTRRAAGRFCAAQSPRSFVRHREGASTGAASQSGSAFADYFFSRSRVLHTRKFHRGCLPTVVLAIGASAAWRLVRGRFGNAVAVGCGLWDGLSGRSAFVANYAPPVRGGADA